MAKAYLFTGRAGAGKTTVASTFAENNNLLFIELGSAVRNLAAEYHDIEVNELESKQLSKTATTLRQEFGGDVFAQEVTESLTSNEDVVISGVRSIEALEHFRDYFDETHLINIETDFEVRYERIKSRDREGEDEFTRDDLKERDSDENQRGVKEVMALSDININNNSSLQETVEEIEDYLRN